MASSAEIVTEAERLHRGNQWREAFEYLKAYSDEATEPEILWRQLRAYYRVGKHLAKDKQETEYIMQKGLEIMERATKTHEDHFQVQKVRPLSVVLIFTLASLLLYSGQGFSSAGKVKWLEQNARLKEHLMSRSISK